MRPCPDTATRITPDRFRELYLEHAGRLCAWLTRLLRGDETEAEGIVQDSFLKAWQCRDEIRDPAAFRAWLYATALNMLRQRKRRLRPVTGVDCEPVGERPSPERQVAGVEELGRVMGALDRLSGEQREAVLLVRMHSMKFREAADILGVSENTVKTRVRRGLLRLAEELEGC